VFVRSEVLRRGAATVFSCWRLSSHMLVYLLCQCAIGAQGKDRIWVQIRAVVMPATRHIAQGSFVVCMVWNVTMWDERRIVPAGVVSGWRYIVFGNEIVL
jgi:hypothetical protein